VREFLAERLPDYMVPAAFVVLDELPLTTNGKINRRALPAPTEMLRRDAIKAMTPPRNPLEEEIASIWREVLNLPACGVFDNFFDLGGHSLLATQLLFRMHEALKVTLPLRALFATATIASMAEIIASIQLGETAHQVEVVDLQTEAVLDASISPWGAQAYDPAQTTNPQAVLLTGATGFLGAFLLSELLRSTPAKVYCLVRATDSQQALERITKNLQRYELPLGPGTAARVVALPGDLGLPRLGLRSEEFRKLAEEIESIYHNGALINFTYPYSRIRAPNVGGTTEILRLACTTRVKPVHYISTSAVLFNRTHPKAVLHEKDRIDAGDVFTEAYVRSKWVAEELIRAAQSRGVPASIYRPLRVVGASNTGACQDSDLFWLGMKAGIEIGALPDKIPIPVDAQLVPVDYAAKAIVQISRQPDSIGSAFHIAQPNPPSFSEVFSWIRAFGYPLEKVSVDDWKQMLLEAARQEIYSRSPRNTAVSRIATLLTLVPIEEHIDFTLPKFDSRQARAVLKRTSVKCPPLDLKLTHHYLSYFVGIGYLPQPPEEARDSASLAERIQNSAANKLYSLIKKTKGHS